MIKKVILPLFFTLFLFSNTFTQSGWQTGNWYQYQGQSWTEWQDVFVGYDFFGYPMYQRMCRNTTWYKEYRTGYVNVWVQMGGIHNHMKVMRGLVIGLIGIDVINNK